MLILSSFRYVQGDFDSLTNETNELKFRLQAMEQQEQLLDGMYQDCIRLMVHEYIYRYRSAHLQQFFFFFLTFCFINIQFYIIDG